MRKLATIRKIKDIQPILDADNIEKAIIDGWEVVISKKDNFKIGDLVVYIEIDSIVPERPEFEFLRNKNFRIRTTKFLGQISQGLILPLHILPNVKSTFYENDDVTEILGVKKYDPQVEDELKLQEQTNIKSTNPLINFLLRFKFFRRQYIKSNYFDNSFPSGVSKTDEERIQNLTNQYSEFKKYKYFVTEKIDGQSATYVLDLKKSKNKQFIVASRNFSIAQDDSSYWFCAEKYQIEKLLRKIAKQYPDADKFVIQGEILAPKIQGNKYKKDEPELFVFNIIINGKLLDYNQQKILLKDSLLENNQVELLYEDFELPDTVADLINLSKGKSKLAKINREGIVVRNYEKSISFKAINPDFLLIFEE